MNLGKSNFRFLTFFETLTFLENYPPKYEVLVSISGTGCGSFDCISGDAFFLHKKFDPGKIGI